MGMRPDRVNVTVLIRDDLDCDMILIQRHEKNHVKTPALFIPKMFS